MKRILYIHHGGEIGGAPLSLLYLIQHLDRSRYEPVVVTLRPGPVVDRYRAEDIEVRVEPGISDFSHTTLEWYGERDWWRLPGKLLRLAPSALRTSRLIRDLQPDLVHLNSSTLAACAAAAWRAGVPVVWHIREPLAQGLIGLRRALLRRAVDRFADRVVAISQYDADQLIPSPRIRVIYNFVDFTRFDRAIDGAGVREELGIAQDSPVVLMLGGVAEPKGTLVLVQALPDLLAAVPGVRIIVAGPALRPGGGGWKAPLRRLLGADLYARRVQAVLDAAGPDVQGAVQFVGIREDIPRLLAASTCLVFPSTVPHFARPIIEAAAMGVPAVASDVGGPRELIVPGETGLLVAPGDPAALVSALAGLLTNPVQARLLGESAYHRACGLFEARANAAATAAVYEEIFANQPES